MIYNKYFTLFYFLLISFSFGSDRHEAYMGELGLLTPRVKADIKREVKDKLQQFNYLSTIDTVEANKIILAEDGDLDNNSSPERIAQAKQMIFRHFVDLSLNDSEWNNSYKYPKFSEQVKDAFEKNKDLVLKEHLSYLAVSYEIIDGFLKEWLQGHTLTLEQILQKID